MHCRECLVAVLLLTACGGGGLQTRDPEQACEELCTVVCEGFCAPEGAQPDLYVADCSSDCVASLECERAVELGKNYDECLDALDSDGECRDPGAGALPTICQAVILVPT